MLSPRRYEYNNRFRYVMPDHEWLAHEHLVLGRTIQDIARGLECDPSVVQNWTRKLDIYSHLTSPVKVGTGSGARFYGVTKKWLTEQYVTEAKSANTIAHETGTTVNAVMIWLRKNGIPTRTSTELADRHSKRMTGENNPAYTEGKDIKFHKRKALRLRGSRCQWCGVDKDLQVHHKDHSRGNGNADNLMILCRNCNCLEAHAWNLIQKGLAVSFEYVNGQFILTYTM